tara:strand:- start:3497 stop:5500 length:2004 start_codon:yes stop_codon:yes gene_type:complete
MAKFSAIPCCKLESNPITDFDKDSRKGYGYRKSVKEKIELDYWVLLRMYLSEVSEAVLKNAEDVVFNGKANTPYLRVGKTIEWLEHSVHIDGFNASFLNAFSMADWKAPLKFSEYQGIVAFTALAWSGLRDSNVTWLDVRNYAQCCPKEYSNDDFVELWVNTDKARTEPYTSLIPGHVMRLLDRAAKLRMEVKRSGFDEPIPYRGDSTSKWPSIIPLLQRTKANGSAFSSGNFLVKVLLEFEECLLTHNEKMEAKGESTIQFKSSLYRLPLYANQGNFRKTQAFVHATQDYSATLRNIVTGESSLFTPIKQAAIWTPHSLRTTFDSVCSVLADPETVGLISTGQKPETVGYYTINTPEEVARIKAIHDKSGLKKQFHPSILEGSSKAPFQARIASISDSGIDEADYLTKHALGTAAADFGCRSLSAITVNGLKPPIETLIQASATEIAFNRTHICPFNNECPKEVIAALLGEKCCAICPYAIIGEGHAIAISAELKRLGDLSADITRRLKSVKSLLTTEKAQMVQERQLIIKSISGWLVRHNFLKNEINSGNYFTGRKNDKLLKHISGSLSGQNIIDRLIETDGVSTVTSPRLEREASRLNRKLTALMNRQPEVLEALEDYSSSESEISIQLIRTICDVNNITERQLVNRLTSDQPNLPDLKWISAL